MDDGMVDCVAKHEIMEANAASYYFDNCKWILKSRILSSSQASFKPDLEFQRHDE